MNQALAAIAISLMCLNFFNISAQAGGTTKDFATVLDEATSAVPNAALFEEKIKTLLEALPQTSEGYFIVDGDVRMTEKEIRHMVNARFNAQKGHPTWPESAKQGELIVNLTVDGEITCWRTAADRKLTYAIDKGSFSGAPEAGAYEKIKIEMKKAGEAWEAACPECGIKFVLIANPAPVEGKDALFIVKYVGDRYASELPGLLALAFFPKDDKTKRYIEIAEDYYSTTFDRVGILRHEIGHVLGYRHEQIRETQPIQCGFSREDKSWIAIPGIKYDPKSVMHYPCASMGLGTNTFALSKVDEEGHRKFYKEGCVP